jgi:hypothetical protein
MLKIGEWIAKVNLAFAKWSYGLFVLSLLMSIVLHNFILTGCTDGSLSYGGCMFMGNDVSYEVTLFSWGSIVLFLAGSVFTVIFKIFEFITAQYKNQLRKDSDSTSHLS